MAPRGKTSKATYYRCLAASGDLIGIVAALVIVSSTALAQLGPGVLLKSSKWSRGNSASCSWLAGGSWVAVPGDSIYGTSDFCVQKYVPANVSSVPTSQAGSAPWINITQSAAISACSGLGSQYHLITNPEWMTIASNIARTPSNWSGGAIGSGTLSRGNSSSTTSSGCAADASDTNAYVNSSCVGSSTGTFNQRRTQYLSNGSVVWDIGGNLLQWVNYANVNDKPASGSASRIEFTNAALTSGTATTPRAHLVPINSAQNWWTDTWTSTQGLGQYNPGTNGSGGGLMRSGSYSYNTYSGPFYFDLSNAVSGSYTDVGFRCAWTPLDCSGLAGGTWVKVPGNPVYGTSDFCVQKYAASNVSNVATAQAGQIPWVSISQTDAIAKCSALGTGYHLMTNPEWMTVATNLARNGVNWSGGAVGSGTLSRGNSDSITTGPCAADANDLNAYVNASCVGSSSGTFNQRRSQFLTNGNVIWDIGGNLSQWVNYTNLSDKPGNSAAWLEFTNTTATPSLQTGTVTTPRSHLVPMSSQQAWWNDSWNSTQVIGRFYPEVNGTGGSMYRGARSVDGANAGMFTALLDRPATFTYSMLGFRCSYTSKGPNSIPNLKLWLRADSLNGLADGTAVPTWMDESGNGFNVTQSTVANQPIFKTGQINGLPVLRFNGSTSYMQGSFTGSITNKTMFVVNKLATLTPTSAAAGGAAATVQSADGSVFDAVVYNEYTAKRWMNGSDVFARTPNTVSASDETILGPLLIAIRSATASYVLYRNGIQLQSTASYSPTTFSAGKFNISMRHAPSGTPVSNGYFNGDIAEVLIYDRALSDAERQSVEAYLKSKYGI